MAAGRVSFNPLKHVDPFGTILLPGLLLLLRSPFVFGYAKPVPVNFRALRSPRRDMVLVAAAGPAMNIALAVAAALLFHLVGYLPATIAPWAAENLKNGLIINVVLAVFNLFPLPPLDGGRILVGVLPKAMAAPVVRLEPFGIAILLGLLIVLPLLGAQLGVDLNIVSRVIRVLTGAILDVILRLTGNADKRAGDDLWQPHRRLRSGAVRSQSSGSHDPITRPVAKNVRNPASAFSILKKAVWRTRQGLDVRAASAHPATSVLRQRRTHLGKQIEISEVPQVSWTRRARPVAIETRLA